MKKSKENGEGLPLPGVITSFREDLQETINWKVSESFGDFDTSVDITSGILHTPLSGDSYSKRIQLRQLIQIRCSPLDNGLYKAFENFSSGIVPESLLRSAELCRINKITEEFAARKGIEDELDGSEKIIGKRLATANSPSAWNKAVEYTIINSGRKGFDSFASGVRSVNPDWSQKLRNLNKEIIAALNEPVDELGDTTPKLLQDEKYYPQGFLYAWRVANLSRGYISGGGKAPKEINDQLEEEEDERASNYGESDPDSYVDEKNRMERERMELDDSDITDDFEFQHTGAQDEFDVLRIDDSLPLNVEVKGYMTRKRRGMTSGRHIAYPSRMLTDPQRRVFGQKVRVRGGIIVIDVSGSMNLHQEDIEAIVDVAPAAVILAYSEHGGENPNAWILANRGWRAKDIERIHRNNNGVDGPALTWAIRHRHHNEDIIWVSDGEVTGINGSDNYELAVQCAKLVKKHKIIMIPSVEEAVRMFKQGRIINKPAGPIRVALLGKL